MIAEAVIVVVEVDVSASIFDGSLMKHSCFVKTPSLNYCNYMNYTPLSVDMNLIDCIVLEMVKFDPALF